MDKDENTGSASPLIYALTLDIQFGYALTINFLHKYKLLN